MYPGDQSRPEDPEPQLSPSSGTWLSLQNHALISLNAGLKSATNLFTSTNPVSEPVVIRFGCSLPFIVPDIVAAQSERLQYLAGMLFHY
jgi:hypothetical protein